jgi:hypothetical protein
VEVLIVHQAIEYQQLSMCYLHIHQPKENQQSGKTKWNSSLLFSIHDSVIENLIPNNLQQLLNHPVEKLHMLV